MSPWTSVNEASVTGLKHTPAWPVRLIQFQLIMIYGTTATGLTLFMGYAGQLSIGHDHTVVVDVLVADGTTVMDWNADVNGDQAAELKARGRTDLRTSPAFVDLYRAIWVVLREEVIKSQRSAEASRG